MPSPINWDGLATWRPAASDWRARTSGGCIANPLQKSRDHLAASNSSVASAEICCVDSESDISRSKNVLAKSIPFDPVSIEGGAVCRKLAAY